MVLKFLQVYSLRALKALLSYTNDLPPLGFLVGSGGRSAYLCSPARTFSSSLQLRVQLFETFEDDTRLSDCANNFLGA